MCEEETERPGLGLGLASLEQSVRLHSHRSNYKGNVYIMSTRDELSTGSTVRPSSIEIAAFQALCSSFEIPDQATLTNGKTCVQSGFIKQDDQHMAQFVYKLVAFGLGCSCPDVRCTILSIAIAEAITENRGIEQAIV